MTHPTGILLPPPSLSNKDLNHPHLLAGFWVGTMTTGPKSDVTPVQGAVVFKPPDPCYSSDPGLSMRSNQSFDLIIYHNSLQSPEEQSSPRRRQQEEDRNIRLRSPLMIHVQRRPHLINQFETNRLVLFETQPEVLNLQVQEPPFCYQGEDTVLVLTPSEDIRGGCGG